jgi:hypothetical protein
MNWTRGIRSLLNRLAADGPLAASAAERALPASHPPAQAGGAGPAPRDDWQPPRQRTTDPFEDPDIPVIGHIRAGFSFRPGVRK